MHVLLLLVFPLWVRYVNMTGVCWYPPGGVKIISLQQPSPFALCCTVSNACRLRKHPNQARKRAETRLWSNLILCCFLQSTFLSLMTSTASEAASYEFTTLTCIPGVIEVHTLQSLRIRTLEASDNVCSYSIYIHVWCFSVQRGQHPVTGSARNHRGCCTG